MKDFRDRLRDELVTVKSNLIKLAEFIEGSNKIYMSLDTRDKELLYNQLETMTDYCDILEERIERLA